MRWPIAASSTPFQLQALLGHKDARSTQIYVQGVEGMIKGLWD